MLGEPGLLDEVHGVAKHLAFNSILLESANYRGRVPKNMLDHLGAATAHRQIRPSVVVRVLNVARHDRM